MSQSPFSLGSVGLWHLSEAALLKARPDMSVVISNLLPNFANHRTSFTSRVLIETTLKIRLRHRSFFLESFIWTTCLVGKTSARTPKSSSQPEICNFHLACMLPDFKRSIGPDRGDKLRTHVCPSSCSGPRWANAISCYDESAPVLEMRKLLGFTSRWVIQCLWQASSAWRSIFMYAFTSAEPRTVDLFLMTISRSLSIYSKTCATSGS